MKLLREPLLHFTLLGALLFGAYAWLNRGEADPGTPDRTIRLTEREVNWLVESSTRQWQRAPSETELNGLVTEYLREELLAREARELELDRDDTIVRRRLAQKMTFLLEDTARLSEPTDAELRALYDAQSARFDEPERSTFEQIYFSREKRGDRATEDAKRVLARLQRDGRAPENPEMTELGDGTLLPSGLVDADRLAISGQFGEEFARTVLALDPGAWQGPIESSFGLHLVRVSARQTARPRPFESVREELVAEWRRVREGEAKEAYFADLLQKYDVQVSETVRPLLGSALATLRGEAN